MRTTQTVRGRTALIVALAVAVPAALAAETPERQASPTKRSTASDDAGGADLAHARGLVERYKQRFRVVDATDTVDLGELYAEDIVLEDPISRVEGLPDVRRYLDAFVERSAGARFEMRGEIVAPEQAAVFWTMVFPGEDGKEGRRVDGVSHLRFERRVHFQRDYFDLGKAVYGEVPVLGWLTELVDSQLEPEGVGAKE